MARKHYRPKEIIGKLREEEVLFSRGKRVTDVVKELGIHEITYYRWRKEYGGMRVDQMKRLKELEQENVRLRKVVSDLTLDKMIIQLASRYGYRKVTGLLRNAGWEVNPKRVERI